MLRHENAFLPLSLAYRISLRKTPMERDIYGHLRKRAKMVYVHYSYGDIDWKVLDALDKEIDAALSDYVQEGGRACTVVSKVSTMTRRLRAT
jgi:hypothetical protein